MVRIFALNLHVWGLRIPEFAWAPLGFLVSFLVQRHVLLLIDICKLSVMSELVSVCVSVIVCSVMHLHTIQGVPHFLPYFLNPLSSNQLNFAYKRIACFCSSQIISLQEMFEVLYMVRLSQQM